MKKKYFLNANIIDPFNYIDEVGLDGAVKNFQKARQEYYEKLKTFETFGRGWTRRVNETTELAISMI